MGTLLDDWNDPKARKMRELYAEQDRKQQAMDGNADAADLAALSAENAELREALEGMLEWFGKYPEFVPSGDALESGKIDTAIQQARAALAEPRKE